MRRVIVSSYLTLDGRVDELQDWTIPYNGDAAVAYHTDLLRHSDGLLLGRRTYEIFAAIWPPRSGELPYIDQINSMTKHVASTTLRTLGWQNSHLIEGDVAEGVDRLRHQPGQDLVVYGCRELTGTLQEHDLIDEFSFWKWSRQALGPKGTALGWTPLLRKKVGGTAKAGLDTFMAKERARA